jgi:hypothetical protein
MVGVEYECSIKQETMLSFALRSRDLSAERGTEKLVYNVDSKPSAYRTRVEIHRTGNNYNEDFSYFQKL